jgi:predicted nuclease of predicted toxin-antitoxin system
LSLNILADECVDFRVVRRLRDAGFSVLAVSEQAPSISDREVLELAKTHAAILITEDHHFGQWVFAHHEKEVGVIFLRYRPAEIQKIVFSLVHILQTYHETLHKKFVVIRANKIRVRDM